MGFTALPVLFPFRFRFRSSSRAIQLRSLLLSLPFPCFPAPPLFLPLTLSDSLPFLSFPPFGFLLWLSFSTLSSFFFLPSVSLPFRASLRPRLLSFRTFPPVFWALPTLIPFFLPLCLSALLPFLAFRFRFLPGPSSLSSFLPCLLFRSFELLFRPAVSLPFRASLRFRFSGAFQDFFKP